MGILAPVLLTVFGAVLDYTLIYNKSSKLQAAADTAALSAARELGITGTKDGEIKNITKDYVYNNLAMSGIDEADKNDLEIKTHISDDRKDLQVQIEYTWQPLFVHLLDADVLPIKINAVASLTNDTTICTLALERTREQVFSLQAKPQ